MKKIILLSSGIILIILIIFLSLAKSFYSKIYKPKAPSKQAQTLKPKTTFNLLLLGYAGGNHQGTFLTDTIIFAHIDKKNKQALLISIPRDLWVKLPTKSKQDFHTKINSVYEIGLYPNTYPDVDKSYLKESKTGLIKHTIKQITGLDVDSYITIDFAGFVNAIDILGGINVNVETAFEDAKYPVEGKENDLCGKDPSEQEELEKIATESPELAYPCRYELIRFEIGDQIMTGEAALKFSRSRNSDQDGGDFGRAKRQQLILESVKNKILSIGFIPKILPLLDELGDHIETDIPFDQMQQLLSEIKDANNYKVKRIVITNNDYLDYSRSEDGQFILIPKKGIDNWTDVKKWIKNTINQPEN